MNGEWLRLGVGGVVPVSWDLTSKDGPGGLEGWASVFHNIDQQDDIVTPGAFKKTLADWRSSGRAIPLSKDHSFDSDAVIGSLTHAEELPYGLRIKASFASTPDAQALRTKAVEKHINGLSIFGPIFQKGSTTRDGRPIRVLKEVGLLQVALTPYPANVLSLTTAAKGAMPMHHTMVVDEAWDDGPAVAASNTEAEHRHMFAVLRDGADPALKDSYALPHHRPGTDGPAVIEAVRNAMARLPQMQGLSDAEKATAKAHMQAHLDDFAKAAALDPQWEDDLRAALRISSAPVRQVAIDSLMKARYPQVTADTVPDSGVAAPTGDDVHKTTGQVLDDAAMYALSLIGESGPSNSPGGEPNPSLVDLEAIASAEATSAELTALEAELRQAG